MSYTEMPFRLVIAIDFGTSRSGYAYCFNGDSYIYTRKDWPAQPYKYPKTPTHLLYTADGKFVGWGANAINLLVQQREKYSGNGYYFFEKFKTLLHEECPVAEKGPYIEKDGKKFFAVDLIAEYLKQLRELALRDIKKATKDLVEETDIRWCLTVPAIWSDAAKQVMEQAAIQAGLISSSSDDLQRLVFALEPEAAAVYCIEEDKALAQESQRGTRIMIVDCGGGTVDITVHEITAEGLKEVVTGLGGLYGGKNVDADFRLHLGEILGNKAVVQFEEQFPGAYQKMMDDWETFKCSYDPELAGDTLKFDLPSRLRELLEKQYFDTFQRFTDIQDGDNHAIWIPRKVMEEQIFGQTIHAIIQCVKQQFAKLDSRGVDYLYLVGGFAASVLLQQRINSQFASIVRKKVIYPKEPGGAIVTGAASFGRNPALIRARRARLTYGVDISTPFIEGFHKEEKKYPSPEHNNALYCDDIFSAFVTAGQSVDINSEVTNLYNVMSAYQKEVIFKIYASTKAKVTYVDEAGVTQIGNLSLKMPFTTGGLDRKMKVTMYFGETKIRVKAQDLTTGSSEETESHVDFSTTYSSEKIGE
jgi:molecular chaperone DnaK (HSP70)